METIKELKNETTLADITHNINETKNFLLFAVIIDISEPYKTQTTTNFTTKMKIIDPSFNYKSVLNNDKIKFHKYTTVYIYSETPDNAPKIQNVGDIIRLRRFNFKIGKRSELVGFMQKYSNWLIYSGDVKGSEFSECFKNYDKNKDRKLNEYEKGRLADLRNWNNNFFFQNSLKYISWWTSVNQSSSTNSQGVDLILECYDIDAEKKKLFFRDEDLKDYELVLKNEPNDLKNQVIKLKHINVQQQANKPNVINLTMFSSCLIVPKYFYDARKFKKIQKKHKPNQGAQYLLEKYDFLKNYNLENFEKYEDKILVSVVKDSYNNLPFVKLKDLQKNILNFEKQKFFKFKTNVDIVGVLQNDINSILKVVDTEENKIVNFKDIKDCQEKELANKKLLLNIVFIIKDDSLEKNDTEYLYLTSQEDEDLHLIQTWDIIDKKNSLKEWINLPQKKLKQLRQNFQKLSDPEFIAECAVEIVKTKTEKIFLKMIDTIFLPIN